jgi:hypothetical protein
MVVEVRDRVEEGKGDREADTVLGDEGEGLKEGDRVDEETMVLSASHQIVAFPMDTFQHTCPDRQVWWRNSTKEY